MHFERRKMRPPLLLRCLKRLKLVHEALPISKNRLSITTGGEFRKTSANPLNSFKLKMGTLSKICYIP